MDWALDYELDATQKQKKNRSTILFSYLGNNCDHLKNKADKTKHYVKTFQIQPFTSRDIFPVYLHLVFST